MTEENRTQRSNTADSAVASAAKTGKAIANIAKGAATGGVHGAALAAAGNAKKWIIPLVALAMLPVLLLAMLPSIIFGAFFGDGTDTPSGFTDETVLTQNMTELHTAISTVLSEGLTETLAKIDSNFSSSGCDEKVVINPYGADVNFNANYFISMYCASKNTDIESINVDDMVDLLRKHKDKLYSFTYADTTSVIEVPAEVPEGTESTTPPEPQTVTIVTRTYTISYNGESYFSDEIFALSDDQKELSDNYAQNLSVFLNDGSYQVLSGSDYASMGVSYEGVVFSDGSTPVTYYSQLDDRWRYSPYGTDDIGGYACGPTSMAIVVSSLTSEPVDPPPMAQWAYENGYWCSKSGSYHSLIPGAAEAWGLTVEGCTSSEPQRIVDALADGKLVVALMTKGHFTSSGHFIVLRGVTSSGKILVADPASYSRSEKQWDLKIILDEASRSAGAGGPFWIIG